MPVKGELWVNRILSILMIGVLLYTFFGNRQNVVDDKTQADIDAKPDAVDVLRWDSELSKQIVNGDNAVRAESTIWWGQHDIRHDEMMIVLSDIKSDVREIKNNR